MRFHPDRLRATLRLIVSFSALAGCEGGAPSADGAGTVVVTPEAGGTIQIEEGPLAGVTLVVPAGAVAEPVEITVAPREDLDEAERPIDVELDPAAIGDLYDGLRETVEGFDEVDSYGVLFLLEAVRQRGHEQAGPVLALSPSGLTFDRPVSLTLPYDESALTDPALAVALSVAHWSDDGRVRMVRPLSVDEDARTVTVELDHFSDVSPTSGAANVLAQMGAARTGAVPPVAVPPTGFFERLSRRVGGDCAPGDLTRAVERLTDVMSNGCDAGALDTTIPPTSG
jgi:hypothetical protein